MDLTPTKEQEDLRAEVRAWLQENLPWEYGTGLPPMFDDLAEEVSFLRDWQARLAAAGWVGVTWPVEYGGRGLGPAENFVVKEELARARARQASPDWKAGYRATRPRVERQIGHLMRRRHGGRRARVRGRVKVAADFALLAAAVNLARLGVLGVTYRNGAWAAGGG